MTQFTLTYSNISISTSTVARFRAIKYRILLHQKTPLRYIKFANSIPPTYTSQLIHLLVLTTSSDYLLILAGLASWNTVGDFKGVRHFEAKF